MQCAVLVVFFLLTRSWRTYRKTGGGDRKISFILSISRTRRVQDIVDDYFVHVLVWCKRFSFKKNSKSGPCGYLYMDKQLKVFHLYLLTLILCVWYHYPQIWQRTPWYFYCYYLIFAIVPISLISCMYFFLKCHTIKSNCLRTSPHFMISHCHCALLIVIYCAAVQV